MAHLTTSFLSYRLKPTPPSLPRITNATPLATCGTGVIFRSACRRGLRYQTPCLRSASPSYRSACAAPCGCRARAHDAAANSSAPHITTRFSARSSDSTTSRACRNVPPSARRDPHTPMQKKRNASAPGKRSPNPTVGARHAVPERPTSKAQPSRTASRRSTTKLPQSSKKRRRKRAKPAEQRLEPSPPLTTKDAFAVLFGDATTIAAKSSPFARVAKPSGSAAAASSPSAREAKSASSAAFASSPSRAVESSAPAASPVNTNHVAKNPRAAIGKRAQNPTVGAWPAAAGKHVKAVPERPASAAQPSSTTLRRGRSKTAQHSTKRKRKRAQSSPSARTTKSSRPAATPAAEAIAAQPISSALPPRIRIGDAMRRSGLDEYKVARTFAVVVDKLSDGKTAKDTGGVQKLLVDVLKECSRHLDPPQSERAAPAAPAQIIMVHNVPRPVRAQTPQQQLNPAPANAAVVPPSAAQSAAPPSESGASAAPASEPVTNPKPCNPTQRQAHSNRRLRLSYRWPPAGSFDFAFL